MSSNRLNGQLNWEKNLSLNSPSGKSMHTYIPLYSMNSFLSLSLIATTVNWIYVELHCYCTIILTAIYTPSMHFIFIANCCHCQVLTFIAINVLQVAFSVCHLQNKIATLLHFMQSLLWWPAEWIISLTLLWVFSPLFYEQKIFCISVIYI